VTWSPTFVCTRPGSKLVPLLVCSLSIAACGGGGQRSSVAARPNQVTSPIVSCSSNQLSLAFVGTQGAPGHLEATFAFRNHSGASCSLRGYPGAQLVDAQGRQLQTQLKWGHGFFPDTMLPPRTVVIEPGRAGRFGLSFATNNEYGGGISCATAAWLDSVPPNAYQSLRVALTGGGHPVIAPCGRVVNASPVYRP
jgi:hypothetical protein